MELHSTNGKLIIDELRICVAVVGGGGGGGAE